MARPLRLKGVSYRGPGAYFVTTCTNQRGPRFSDSGVVDVTLGHFLQCAERTGIEVSAYCFMPDHLHLLVTSAGERSSLDAFMRGAKQASGYAFKQSTGQKLWQTGYHERVLRSDEETLTVIAHMVANPIRAGLVDRAARRG